MTTESLNRYDIGQLIGKGGFGSVYRGRNRSTNLIVAIKIVTCISLSTTAANTTYPSRNPRSLDSNTRAQETSEVSQKAKEANERLRREIQIYKQCHHKHIIQLYDCFQLRDSVYFVMEYSSLGNLYQLLSNSKYFHQELQESSISLIMNHLLSAVSYLHKRNIVHRDIKLSNVLLCPKSVFMSHQDHDDLNEIIHQCEFKLCDFGLAIQLTHPDEEHFTVCGSPNYIAPEIIRRNAHSFPVDIWSLGCLMMNMATRLQSIHPDEFHSMYTTYLTDFLSKLSEKDPKARSDIFLLARHPFIHQPRSYDEDSTCNTTNASISISSVSKSLCTQETNASTNVSRDAYLSPDRVKQVDESTKNILAMEGIDLKPSHEPITSSIRSSGRKSILRRSYRDSISKLRESSRQSFSNLSSSRYAALDATTSTSVSVPSSSSTAIHHRASVHSSLASDLKDLSSFLYTSSEGKLLAFIDQDILVYCFSIKSPSLRVYQMFVRNTCLSSIGILRVEGQALKELECLQRGQSIDDIAATKSNGHHHGPIKSSLTFIGASVTEKISLLCSSRFLEKNPAHILQIDDLPAESAIAMEYQKLGDLLRALRARIPRLVMYLTIDPIGTLPGDVDGRIRCKCVLMSNLPLPNFCIQFKDRTAFRYELSTGSIRIDYYRAGKRARWEGSTLAVDGSDSSIDILPGYIKSYFLIAQRALDKCLIRNNRAQIKEKKYPIVDVDCI
jgi:serine/threonine protein kinase